MHRKLTSATRYAMIVLCCLFLFTALTILTLLVSFQSLVSRKIAETIKITNGSLIHRSWLTPGQSTKFSIYMYNVTNPNDILAGKRPIVQEIGPYVYWQKKKKMNITWSRINNRDAVSYYVTSSYAFDRQLSVGDPSVDNVTNLSLSSVALSTTSKSKQGSFHTLLKILDYFVEPKLFLSQSVANFLWGYSDDIMSICHSFLPSKCKSTKLGLLLNANQSISGPYTIDNGNLDISKIGQILSIKNQSFMNIWTTSESNKIQGTDGSQFSPNLEFNASQSVYVGTLCRPLYFIATEKTSPTGYPNMEVLLLQLDQSNFEIDEGNFCALHPLGARCPPRGLFDITDCRVEGEIKPSIFASLPHFLYANESIPKSFDGIRQPNKFTDDIKLYVEPKTGLAVEAYSRLQINLFVEKSDIMQGTFGEMIDNLYFPVAWFEEETHADMKDLKYLHTKVNTEPDRAYTFLMCLCIICFLFSGVIISILIIHFRLGRICTTSRSFEVFTKNENTSAQMLIANSSDCDSEMLQQTENFGKNPWGLRDNYVHEI